MLCKARSLFPTQSFFVFHRRIFVKNFYSRKSIPTVTTISMLCDGLGITLAQFVDVDGDTVHLTAEQQRVINRWDALTDREKEVIDGMMDIALENHK